MSITIIRCLILIIVLLLIDSIPSTIAAFCGVNGMPYSFEVLPSGLTVLGCAMPTCFGGGNAGRAVIDTSKFFLNIDSTALDGYFRADDREHRRIRHSDAPQQLAHCHGMFTDYSCPNPTQWVGGIAPFRDAKQHLLLQCCTYEGLKYGRDLGFSTLHKGELIVGGEVERNNRQMAFDVISNIQKYMDHDGIITYDVSFRRMNCIPEPREIETNVTIEIQSEILRTFGQTPLTSAIEHNSILDGEQTLSLKEPIITEQIWPHSIGDQQYKSAIDDSLQLVESAQNEPKMPTSAGIVQQDVNSVQQPALISDPDQQVEAVEVVDLQEVRPVDIIELEEIGEAVELQPVQQVAESQFASQLVPYDPSVGSAAAACFTADMTVRTQNFGIRRMDELKIGDYVLSAEKNQPLYVPIIAFLHRLPDRRTEFVLLETSNSRTIKLTPRHFIYTTNCQIHDTKRWQQKFIGRLVEARHVQVGDCLFESSIDTNQGFSKVRIIRTSRINSTGIYAPLTSNGDIIVNHMLVSCHSIIQHSALQQTFFNWIQSIETFIYSWFSNKKQYTSNHIDLPFGVDYLLTVIDYIIPATQLIN